MKISTRLRLAVYVPALMALVIIVALGFSYQDMGKIQKNGDTVRRVRSSITELNHLVFSYVLYHEERPKQQFLAEHDTLTRLIADAQVQNPDQQRLLASIRADGEAMKDLFLQLVSNYERDRTAGIGEALGGAEDRLAGLLLLKSYEADSDASALRSLVDEGIRITEIRTIGLIFLLIVLTTVPLTIVLVRTRRAITSSLSNLSNGAAVVGSGNLDFTIPVKTADEIGELSRAFNRMTASLKGATASKADLEREMGERQQAELRANRQKAVQEAINRILRGALTFDTDKELGNACLEVAQEVTASKFGFLFEINPQGRLSDIAISDPGWEACRMPEPTGHGKLSTTLEIHGIYGRVVLDGKGFFTNAPASHPDSIGVPPGHPALTAFLGVPLTHDRKTIGVMGLGNREGGYGAEDLEAGEALAPAIIQALMRKRAEEALRERTLALEASNKELEAFSYSVSHDLRAPLRSMDGFSQALLEDYAGKLDAQGREYLQYIRSSSQLMAQLIDDMLSLSRITRTEIALVKVSLSDLAQGVADELKKLQPERRVTWAITPGLEAYGDKYLLKLVFENLLGNAFKFTAGRAEARIEFGVSHRDGAPAYFVRDNGAGFDMAYVDKLFKPFQRLHRAEEFPGTGIGLASVQRIVNRLGGRVWAEGGPDKGATFYFTLRQSG